MEMLHTLLNNGPKYLLEGAAVAVAAHYIPSRKMAMTELLILALTAALTFWLLDTFAPSIATGARFGAGFGIGAKTVGFPGGEHFCGGQEQH